MRLVTPMLPPVAGLVAGIMAVRIGAGMIVAVSMILLSLGGYYFILRKSTNPIKSLSYTRYHHIWIIALFAGIGVLDATLQQPAKTDDEIFGGNYPVAKGYVRDVDYTTAGDRLQVELRSLVNRDGKEYPVTPVGAIIYAKNADARVDDVIVFSNTLSPIQDSPNSFDSGYAESMANKGILYSAILRENHVIKVSGHVNSLKGAAWECRMHLEEFIEKTGLSFPAKRFIISILIGDRSYLDPESRQTFADAGVSHILALSGMHVGIIAGIILWLLFPLNFAGKRLLRYALVVPILWGYAWITGLMPSTVRAALMATFFIGAILLQRKNSSWNSLLAASLLILLCNPMTLYDVGFQLSFTCVAGIVFFSRSLNPVSQHQHPFAYKTIGVILVTLIATGCSWVLSAYYFGTFPLMFLPANMIILPLLPIFVIIVLIYLILSAIGIKLVLLETIIDASYDWMTNFLNALDADGSTVINVSIPGVAVWFWLFAISLLVIFIHYKKSYIILGSSGMLMILAILIPIANRSSAKEVLVKTTLREPHIALKNGNKVTDFRFPANKVSSLPISDLMLIVADCAIDTTYRYPHSDYVLITRSCPTDIETIKKILAPGVLIIHPSVHKDKERAMIHVADSLSLPVHSLRLQSSLRIKVP